MQILTSPLQSALVNVGFVEKLGMDRQWRLYLHGHLQARRVGGRGACMWRGSTSSESGFPGIRCGSIDYTYMMLVYPIFNISLSVYANPPLSFFLALLKCLGDSVVRGGARLKTSSTSALPRIRNDNFTTLSNVDTIAGCTHSVYLVVAFISEVPNTHSISKTTCVVRWKWGWVFWATRW